MHSHCAVSSALRVCVLCCNVRIRRHASLHRYAHCCARNACCIFSRTVHFTTISNAHDLHTYFRVLNVCNDAVIAYSVLPVVAQC